jgi:hypothetical protein
MRYSGPVALNEIWEYVTLEGQTLKSRCLSQHSNDNRPQRQAFHSLCDLRFPQPSWWILNSYDICSLLICCQRVGGEAWRLHCQDSSTTQTMKAVRRPKIPVRNDQSIRGHIPEYSTPRSIRYEYKHNWTMSDAEVSSYVNEVIVLASLKCQIIFSILRVRLRETTKTSNRKVE